MRTVEAFYFKIASKDGEFLYEGILEDSESFIFPLTNLNEDDESLPYETEFHHFSNPNYIKEGYYVQIPVSELEIYRV